MHLLSIEILVLCIDSPALGPVLATRAQQLGMASATRGYATTIDKRQIDEIHRKEGVKVVPGRGETCPHAAAGIAAARRAAELARSAEEARKSDNVTSFESPTTSSNAVKRPQDAAIHMNKATPAFDYNAFYAEELDKKHKDKSYRCVSHGRVATELYS